MKDFKQVAEEVKPMMDVRKKCLYDATNKSLRGDVYLFGVYSGTSVIETIKYMNYIYADYGMVWCFDSFVGLPDEEEVAGRVRNPEYVPGKFSSAELYDAAGETSDGVIKELITNAETDRIDVIPGFFSDSLTYTLAKEKGMKPAMFIDVDVDIYSSTVQLLDFVFESGLVVPGTYIYFDDWGGGVEEYSGGESLAWKEACEKYKVEAVLAAQRGRGIHCQKAFVVQQIN